MRFFWRCLLFFLTLLPSVVMAGSLPPEAVRALREAGANFSAKTDKCSAKELAAPLLKARETAPFEPRLLLSLGLIYDHGGKCAVGTRHSRLFARAYYQSYLAAAPNSKNEDWVRARVSVISRQDNALALAFLGKLVPLADTYGGTLRNDTLRWIAMAYQELGQDEQARVIVLRLATGGPRAGVLADLASIALRAGRLTAAGELLRAALSEAGGLSAAPEPARAVSSLADAAVALAEVGDSSSAVYLSSFIPNTFQDRQAQAHAAVASAFCRSGHTDKGVKWLDTAPASAGTKPSSDYYPYNVRAAVAVANATCGRPEEALKQAGRRILWMGEADMARSDIAKILAERGDLEWARKAADAISDVFPSYRVSALSAISLGMAKAGRHDDALVLAWLAATLAEKTGDWAKPAVARALAASGRGEAGLRLDYNPYEFELRIESLAGVAEACALVRDRACERRAKQLEENIRRAALISLYERLPQNGDLKIPSDWVRFDNPGNVQSVALRNFNMINFGEHIDSTVDRGKTVHDMARWAWMEAAAFSQLRLREEALSGHRH